MTVPRLQRGFRSVVLVATLALMVASCAGETTDTTDTTAAEGTTTSAAGPSESSTTSSTEPAPTASGVLTMGVSNRLITFDPHASQAGNQLSFIEPIFDPLIRDLPNGELAPGLATSWEYTNVDRTELTLEIRDGVIFHDGDPLTAEVVAANVMRARDTAGPDGAGLAVIEQAEVTSPLTVVLHLSSPNPALPNDLSNVPGMIISPAQLESDAVETAPIGTGPWIYDADNSVVGERYIYNLNPDYWDPSVQGVETIEVLEMPDDDARLNALLSGQIEIAIIRANQVMRAEDAALEVITSPERWWGLMLSDRNGEVIPELGDVRVRQALNYAIDRQAIVDATQFGIGEPTSQLFAREAMGYNPDLDNAYPYDPDRAKELLAEAGVTDLTLPTVTLAPVGALAEAIGEYFRDVGVTLDIEVIEPGTLGAAARSTENPTAIFAAGSPDPAQDIDALLLEESPYNPFGFVDPEIVRLAEQGAAGETFEERNAAYQEVSRIVTENAWFVIVYRGQVVAAHLPKVQNVNFHVSRGFAPPSYLGMTVDDG